MIQASVFAVICDDTGKNLYGGQRNGVEDLSEEETIEANLQALATWGLRYPLTIKVGRGKYAMAEFEKIKRNTVPLDNVRLLVVAAEVNVDH